MKKEHILSEIRRTAAANGGVPLGSARFLAETGIKVSDWRGKYWARWSDALKQAELSPNQLNTARPDEDMLRRLAGLVRELGRFPSYAELWLKRRTDPDFPTPNTFKRFGGKQLLLSRLREFLLDSGEKDLAVVCVAPADESGDEQVPVASEPEVGFVYMMKSGRHYKIGQTNSVGRREYELAIQLPEPIKEVHRIKTDDPTGIEEYWHKRFAARRKNGEWFDLSAQDVAAFKRRKFM